MSNDMCKENFAHNIVFVSIQNRHISSVRMIKKTFLHGEHIKGGHIAENTFLENTANKIGS